MEYYDTVIGEDPHFATSFADWSDGEEDPALWNEDAREPARKRRPRPEGRDLSEEEEQFFFMTGGRDGFVPDLEKNPPPGMDNIAGCCTWLINGEAGDAVYL
ncbi:hypothetical protein QOT17_011769 [Balamuthia mandrillaris]